MLSNPAERGTCVNTYSCVLVFLHIYVDTLSKNYCTLMSQYPPKLCRLKSAYGGEEEGRMWKPVVSCVCKRSPFPSVGVFGVQICVNMCIYANIMHIYNDIYICINVYIYIIKYTHYVHCKGVHDC